MYVEMHQVRIMVFDQKLPNVSSSRFHETLGLIIARFGTLLQLWMRPTVYGYGTYFVPSPKTNPKLRRVW